MAQPTIILQGEIVEELSPAITDIVRHLCEGECHAYGDLVEWCESRNDCTIAVVCPSCSAQFIIEEDDMAALERWTEANGVAFGCGIVSDAS